MLARNGERPATDCTVNGARKIVGTDNARSSKPNTHKSQDPICAELHGADTCTTNGITAHGHAPVLTLCRELLAAGLDPDRAMEVYRGATLALRVRSIRDGARLTVEDNNRGTPVLRRWRGPRGSGTASPVRRNEKSAVGGGRP